jgi:hypothetical protein
MTELIPLAGFTLYERAGCGRDGWRSLKLVRTPPQAGEKNIWWFGWDGARLSNSTDSKLLAKHHPEIRQWVIDTLRVGVIDAQQPHRGSRQ